MNRGAPLGVVMVCGLCLPSEIQEMFVTYPGLLSNLCRHLPTIHTPEVPTSGIKECLGLATFIRSGCIYHIPVRYNR